MAYKDLYTKMEELNQLLNSNFGLHVIQSNRCRSTTDWECISISTYPGSVLISNNSNGNTINDSDLIKILPNPDIKLVVFASLTKDSSYITGRDQLTLLNIVPFWGYTTQNMITEIDMCINKLKCPATTTIAPNYFTTLPTGVWKGPTFESSIGTKQSSCDCGGKVLGYKDTDDFGHATWCEVLRSKCV